MVEYDECDVCKNDRCTKDCFNAHVGSSKALENLFKEIGVKGHIIQDRGSTRGKR